VSPCQLLFLIHLMLASGIGWDLRMCLLRHADDIVDGPSSHIPSPLTSASSLYNSLFWTKSDTGSRTPDVAASQIEKACLHATGMIVGASDVDIFSPDCAPECRVFALDHNLVIRCRIALASPTRLLVSPAFVRTVAEDLSASRMDALWCFGCAAAHLLADWGRNWF
jgi:hypothetical protein